MVWLSGQESWGHRDDWRRFPGELGEVSEVLRGCGAQELVAGAGQAPEPEAPETHVTFQVD